MNQAPEEKPAAEMTHDLEMNFNEIAPFGKGEFLNRVPGAWAQCDVEVFQSKLSSPSDNKKITKKHVYADFAFPRRDGGLIPFPL